jgi:FSR family fosmidomycin resistance protein-like MFS transporter
VPDPVQQGPILQVSALTVEYAMERGAVRAVEDVTFELAPGEFIGGPVGDRLGRKYVIWCSILGVLPFTLALPFANLLWTAVLSVVIGVILASAFSAILVYAQELVPGKVGMISGLFFGLAFGMGGIGAAVLGWMADRTGIDFVYRVCSFLPAMGLLTALLPNLKTAEQRQRHEALAGAAPGG